MTDSELFNSFTASFGGRFPRDLAPEHARYEYEQIEDWAQDLISAARKELPNLPPIHVDFIRNRTINALAFKANDRYFIGLNTGTVFMLRWLINRMLSD